MQRLQALQNAHFGLKIKIAKNVSRDTLEFFCAKKGSKKHLMFNQKPDKSCGCKSKP